MLDVRPNNLPSHLTSFVGRERETTEVKRLLGAARLLTLTGPGGSGKTSLALRVASELLDSEHAEGFANGVFFVALATISDPGLVVSTIAHTLGVREAAGRPLLDNLKDVLREKQLLLVLDNFEQLLPAAPLVPRLVSDLAATEVLGDQSGSPPPERREGLPRSRRWRYRRPGVSSALKACRVTRRWFCSLNGRSMRSRTS